MATERDPAADNYFGPWTSGDEKAQEARGESDGYADGRMGFGCPDGLVKADTPYGKGYARGYDRGLEEMKHAGS